MKYQNCTFKDPQEIYFVDLFNAYKAHRLNRCWKWFEEQDALNVQPRAVINFIEKRLIDTANDYIEKFIIHKSCSSHVKKYASFCGNIYKDSVYNVCLLWDKNNETRLIFNESQKCFLEKWQKRYLELCKIDFNKSLFARCKSKTRIYLKGISVSPEIDLIQYEAETKFLKHNKIWPTPGPIGHFADVVKFLFLEALDYIDFKQRFPTYRLQLQNEEQCA